ncbi:Oxidoreductase [Lachnellula hyalina]|uniref:Oxidoreductase n=1 Tax=Lachnellula hyalina TaxID=1316788 RepID=A0A8H8R6P9_9HELO|nr:Oxidoreductase [Lachnellula hyalina]TVY29011.1 Oxidoreductase [Lachnellula hyalina]
MVNIKDIAASNAAFKKANTGLVAVFVGATSGIGMGTLKQFAKNANSPTIYIVGRSQSAAKPLLDELSTSNPEAVLNFIETEVSLMKNVDKACDEIESKETKVDILFVSPGYLSFDGRNQSEEGIDIPHALRYYTRLRFTYNLLPLLKASPNPRVISILAGGREGDIDLSDLEVKANFSGLKAMKNSTTQTTLAFEELAKTNPSVTFIHKYPGFVDTGVLGRLLGTMTGLWALPATFVKWFILPVLNFFSTSIEEAGERGVFLATSARFPPLKRRDGWEAAAVPLPEGVKEISEESGVYRLGAKDESVDAVPVLVRYRHEGVGKTVWESTLAVWERALARSG